MNRHFPLTWRISIACSSSTPRRARSRRTSRAVDCAYGGVWKRSSVPRTGIWITRRLDTFTNGAKKVDDQSSSTRKLALISGSLQLKLGAMDGYCSLCVRSPPMPCPLQETSPSLLIPARPNAFQRTRCGSSTTVGTTGAVIGVRHPHMKKATINLILHGKRSSARTRK